MGKFWGGLIVGLILFPLLGAIYFLGGFAPVAVSDHPFPLEALIAGGSLHARISREAPKRDLSSFTPADIVAGAQAYRKGCAGCHGLPSRCISDVAWIIRIGRYLDRPRVGYGDARIAQT